MRDVLSTPPEVLPPNSAIMLAHFRQDGWQTGPVKSEMPTMPEALPVPVVDSHTHLDTTEHVAGLPVEQALAKAAEVNVTRLAQIGCDVDGSRWAVEIARKHPEVIATVALHPNEAARLGDDLDDAIAAIADLAGDPQVRGIGETGLDYFRTKAGEGHDLQKQSFRAHIALAKEHDKTLVIHDRDAHDDILEVLDAEGCPERIIMHCFSGDADFARECVARGAWLSFPGPVTYKANEALREAARVTPADRILVETDAPYLVPVPWRGHPNASYVMPHTVRFLADLREEPLEEFCQRLTDNAFAAYGGVW